MISRKSTSFRTRSFAIAVVGVMFGLTGCALDGSLGASGDPSVSVTATPTPTATAVYRLADATGKAQNVRIPMLVVQDKIDVLEADGSISQPTTSASKSESVMIASFESGSWKVKDLGLIR